jgi:amidohydrolase
MNPFEYIDHQKESLLKTYCHLHSIAEPSWHEKNTSEYLKAILKDAGLKLHTFKTHYGFIAEIPGLSPEVVALRADMDALMQEVNGVVKANHSCGHDAHSTMVLFTALAIAASKKTPKRTLRFIFQPAEEKGEGALKMMEDGALKNVTHLFGVHLRPKHEVPFMKAAPLIIHGSAGTIKGTIKGVQAHAARPQDGINAIEAAALLVHKLQKIVLETKLSYSIKMTQLKTDNEAANIIPETAVFSIDVRAEKNDLMELLTQMADNLIEETMEHTGTKISWSKTEFVPATVPNEQAIKIAHKAIGEVLGAENVQPVCISRGGEDFHFYTVNNPNLIATMIGLGCDLSPGLHHPHMSFKLESLLYGTKILINTLLLASEA